MKTKTAGIGLLVLAGLLGTCWSIAYRRGYERGAHDEFASWKKEPVRIDANWDGTMVGRRDFWALPGGKKLTSTLVRGRDYSINNIPGRVLP